MPLATTFEVGTPVELFDAGVVVRFDPYVATADGRFLIDTRANVNAATALSLVVVLNWTAGSAPK